MHNSAYLSRPVMHSFEATIPLNSNMFINLQTRRSILWCSPYVILKNMLLHASNRALSHTYTHQKRFSNTHPVEKRGTSIYWNGQNIANTARIRFKFGTMKNQYMPNSKATKIEKTESPNLLCNPLCYVDMLVKNLFWSSNYTPKWI